MERTDRAAGLTLDVLRERRQAGSSLPLPRRDAGGRTLAHALWMLDELTSGRVAGRRGHRWLGYAQAVLVLGGHVSLDDMKEASRLASAEEPCLLPSSPPSENDAALTIRLLRRSPRTEPVHPEYYRNPDGPEAAARIATLGAESARLREALERIEAYQPPRQIDVDPYQAIATFAKQTARAALGDGK